MLNQPCPWLALRERAGVRVAPLPCRHTTLMTSIDPTTPPGSRGPSCSRGLPRRFQLCAQPAAATSGSLRSGADRRLEPAHFEPEVRKRTKARMASPDEMPVIDIHSL